jgi:DNA-binding winged helix-turn-helix (wHTH) protein
VELRLLGPFEIIDDDGKTLELRGAKLNGLLVVLALNAGEVVPTGRIIEDLWGEQEIRDPVNALQVVISKLRRALQPAGYVRGSLSSFSPF